MNDIQKKALDKLYKDKLISDGQSIYKLSDYEIYVKVSDSHRIAIHDSGLITHHKTGA